MAKRSKANLRDKKIKNLMDEADIAAQKLRDAIGSLNVDSDEFKNLIEQNRKLRDSAKLFLEEFTPDPTEPPEDPADLTSSVLGEGGEVADGDVHEVADDAYALGDGVVGLST
jgi:hypothetical protein